MSRQNYIHWERRSIVGPRVRLDGNISGLALELYGEIRGAVSVEGTALLHAGARIIGKLDAAQVILEPGAVVLSEVKERTESC